jgi:hypothetical protein
MHNVPAVGEGIVPVVHFQPGWQNWPISQMSPGMHTADLGGSGESGNCEVAGGELPGGVVRGAGEMTAMHPVSRKARGHRRMCFPPNREQYQAPAKLNRS